ETGNSHRILVFRLLPIELETFHHGSVINGKKNRLFIGQILMRMPLPKGNDKRIPFLPFEVAFSDCCAPLSLENVVARRAGVSMVSGFLSSFEKLNFTRHGGVSESSRGRIDVTQQCTIIRIVGAVAHSLERLVGILPGVAKRNTAQMIFFILRRACKAQTA